MEIRDIHKFTACGINLEIIFLIGILYDHIVTSKTNQPNIPTVLMCMNDGQIYSINTMPHRNNNVHILVPPPQSPSKIWNECRYRNPTHELLPLVRNDFLTLYWRYLLNTTLLSFRNNCLSGVIIRIVVSLIGVEKAILSLHHNKENPNFYFLDFFSPPFTIIFSSFFFLFVLFQSHTSFYTISKKIASLSMSHT